MEAFLVSTGVVAVAEIGDKTQLLALFLAARYRAPVPVILGILAATIANHALAAWFGAAVVGHYLNAWMGNGWMQAALGLSFIAMAGWVLVPDKADEETRPWERGGVFLATLVAFFLVEIGDKTQVATIGLAARFQDVWLVTLGTTSGMMLANVPAVLLGEVAATRIPLPLVRGVAAAILAALGGVALFSAAGILLA